MKWRYEEQMYGKIITPVLVIVIMMCVWHMQMDMSIKKFNTHLMHSFSTYFWVLILSIFYFMWCLKVPQKKLWPEYLTTMCCPSSSWRKYTKHWPKTYLQGCGHKSFNGNAGVFSIIRWLLPCSSFHHAEANTYSNMTESKRNWHGTYT